MFGRDKKPKVEDRPADEDARQLDMALEFKWLRETLADLEREYVAEYGPKQPEWHAAHVADHEADCARFTWRFDRFGDFLLIAMRRHGEKWAQAINLNSVRAIEVRAGEAPHVNGALTLYTEIVGPLPEDRTFSLKPPKIRIRPPEGCRYVPVGPKEPKLKRWGGFEDAIRQRPWGEVIHYQIEHSEYEYAHHIPSDFSAMAEPARDGYVHFLGADIALPCPAGLEQQVHDDLLAEIRDGWEKKPLVATQKEQ